jgi:hypothetical protein
VWFSDLVGWGSLTAEDEDKAIALMRRFVEGKHEHHHHGEQAMPPCARWSQRIEGASSSSSATPR